MWNGSVVGKLCLFLQVNHGILFGIFNRHRFITGFREPDLDVFACSYTAGDAVAKIKFARTIGVRFLRTG